MTTNAIAVRPKQPMNPLRIVASALFLVYGVGSLIYLISRGIIDNYIYSFSNIGDTFTYGVSSGLVTLHILLLLPVSLIGAFASAVLGLVSKRAVLQPLIGAAVFILFYVFSWILQLISIALGEWSRIYFFPGYGEDFLVWLTTGLLLVAILLSGLAWLISKNSKAPLNATSVPYDVTTAPASPLTPANPSGSYNNLPMFALIGAFVVPLAGIILGHLSLSYMKKGQLSEQNKGMATAGLILGYVFVGLGFLVGLILFIVLIVSAASGF
jgi:hypothetical protein